MTDRLRAPVLAPDRPTPRPPPRTTPPGAPTSAAAPARWTVMDVLRWTTSRFEERGLATPRLDAEILTAHALAVPRVQLYVQFDRPLTPDELGADPRVRQAPAGRRVGGLRRRQEGVLGPRASPSTRACSCRGPTPRRSVDEALERIGRAPRARAARAADLDADADLPASDEPPPARAEEPVAPAPHPPRRPRASPTSAPARAPSP